MCSFSVGSPNDDDEEEARERRRRAREERKKMRDAEESGTTDVIDTNRYNMQKVCICGGTNKEPVKLLELVSLKKYCKHFYNTFYLPAMLSSTLAS